MTRYHHRLYGQITEHVTTQYGHITKEETRGHPLQYGQNTEHVTTPSDHCTKEKTGIIILRSVN
jgi:hypothetical protein